MTNRTDPSVRRKSVKGAIPKELFDMPTIPAILSPRRTIYDAPGMYVEDLPVTPEKALKAIREKEATAVEAVFVR